MEQRVCTVMALIFTVVLINGVNSFSERSLLNSLMDGYSRQGRPTGGGSLNSSTVEVKVDFELVQLIEVDEKKQVMEVILWLLQEWHDDELSWSTDKYPGLDKMIVPTSSIWIPDINIYNSLGKTENTLNTFLTGGETSHLTHNGTVSRAPAFLLHTWCKVDVRYYPFDTQKCPIIVSPWTYVAKDMLLVPRKVAIEDVAKDNGQWHLERVHVQSGPREVDCCPGESFSSITYTVHIRRRPGYYIVVIVVPLVMLHVLSTCTFLVPVGSGERLGYSLGTFLAFSVILKVMGDSVPETETVPIININLLVAMFCNMVATMWSVCAASCLHKTNMDPVPAALLSCTQCLRKYLCFNEQKTILRAKSAYFGASNRSKTWSTVRRLIKEEKDAAISHSLDGSTDPETDSNVQVAAPGERNAGACSRKASEDVRIDFRGYQWPIVLQILDQLLFSICLFILFVSETVLVVVIPLFLS